MRTITLFLFAALAVTSVDAASYQKTDGTIVDPIQFYYGGNHSYSGINLEPSAYLYGAVLKDANLSSADLNSANLYAATLSSANLSSANLSDAYLRWASLSYAVLNDAHLQGATLTGAALWGANLTGADLSGSILTQAYDYNHATWTDAFYYTDNEPTWDSGMDAAWRTSAGILALAPTSAVPEPSTILLALLGLALLPRRRRR